MPKKPIEYYLLLLLFLFFLYYTFQAFMREDTFRLFFVLPAFILSLIPLLVEYRMKVAFIPGAKSLVSLALLLHVARGIK